MKQPAPAALLATLNRMSLRPREEGDVQEHTRRALVKQGDALLLRLGEGSVKRFLDRTALPADLRIWTRAARAFARTELRCRDEDLPDDGVLQGTDTAERAALVRTYLALLRAG